MHGQRTVMQFVFALILFLALIIRTQSQPLDLCPPGTYTDDDICTSCPSGTSQPLAHPQNITECAPCEPGRFSDAPSLTACFTCEPGSFSNTSGSTACLTCGTNAIQPSSGAANCIACPDAEVADEDHLACITQATASTVRVLVIVGILFAVIITLVVGYLCVEDSVNRKRDQKGRRDR